MGYCHRKVAIDKDMRQQRAEGHKAALGGGKQMSKGIVIPLMLLALLATLSGCTWFTGSQTGPPLAVVASPTSGHPSATAGGLLVTFRCSGGTGTYSFEPGDGSEGLVFEDGTFTYLYAVGGTHAAVVSSGGRSKTIQIKVINQAPIVYPAFTASFFDWMDKVVLDGRYRLHGCLNGAPVTATGARDYDGDPLTYEWIVTGPDKDGQTVSYTVFDLQRNNITGQRSTNSVVVVFPGWTQSTPPFPFAPRGIDPMCEPTPPPPTPPPGMGTVTLSLRVYDPWGGVGQASWTHSLASGGCSSSP